MKIQAYTSAFAAAKADNLITSEEEADLQKIQKYLKIPDSDLQASKYELWRLRLINEVQNGNLPHCPVDNLIMQKKETAHWVEPASLLEERVVRRRYEGGSSGVSFRIAKGVSYRVGGHRGHIVADTAIVPVSTGDLVLTNKRVIFRGDRKSFNLKFEKILDFEFFSDGMRITEGTGKPRVLKFSRPKTVDIVGAVLSQVINGYEGKE